MEGLTVLIQGVIGVYLFRFRNTNRDWINTISIATIGIFVTGILFFETTEKAGLVTWAISSSALLFAYAMRFKNKSHKEVIDFFKLIAIVLVACYPINFYAWILLENNLIILFAISFLIIPVAGTVYLYDRWILTPEKMKKRFVITLVAQSVFILFALTYAYVQKGIADENLRQAKMAQAEAEKQKKIADEKQLEAEAQAKQSEELRTKLEKCR
jgi:hypothetical protein